MLYLTIWRPEREKWQIGHEPSDKRLNIQLRLDFSSPPTGEARQAGREDIELPSAVNEPERPADTNRIMEEVEEVCERGNLKEALRQVKGNKELAELLEQHHSVCRCEHFSVGEGSPGPVGDDEPLHRIVASPRDYDPDSGTIRAAPFEKVFANGLSVWQAKGPDCDVSILLEESLRRGASEPPKHIHAICEALAGNIRRLQSSDERRLFCILRLIEVSVENP